MKLNMFINSSSNRSLSSSCFSCAALSSSVSFSIVAHCSDASRALFVSLQIVPQFAPPEVIGVSVKLSLFLGLLPNVVGTVASLIDHLGYLVVDFVYIVLHQRSHSDIGWFGIKLFL